MDFDFSEEQQMLHESVTRLLAGRDAGAADGDIWPAYAELGLPGMTLDVSDGGLGMGSVETLIGMRALGRGLCTSSFLASAVYGTSLLRAAMAGRRVAIADDLVAGSARLAVAHGEPGLR